MEFNLIFKLTFHNNNTILLSKGKVFIRKRNLPSKTKPFIINNELSISILPSKGKFFIGKVLKNSTCLTSGKEREPKYITIKSMMRQSK